MEIQKLTEVLIAHISRKTGITGKGLAVADRADHFLLMFADTVGGGEYERVQLDDRAGDAYYIRLKDGKIEEAKISGAIRGATVNSASRVTARCRLVAQSNTQALGALAYNFRNALASFEEPAIQSENIFAAGVSIRAILFDFTTIFYEESTAAEREGGTGWEGNMQICAVDFDLNFTLETCLKSC